MLGEPSKQENDLWERLKTTQKRAEIAMILINKGRTDLLPTILEDLYLGVHLILELFCIEDDK